MHNLESLIEFKWQMLGEDGEETCKARAWYEVLCIVHMIAILSLLQANLVLIPKESLDEHEGAVSEGRICQETCKRACWRLFQFKHRQSEYSRQLNASRMKVLQAYDNLVNSMKESASKELLRVVDNSKAYQKLLKDLIVQSLLRLSEPSVLLRCREMDSQLVKSILDVAKQEYTEKAKVHTPEITIDERVYLPPPPAGDGAHGPS